MTIKSQLQNALEKISVDLFDKEIKFSVDVPENATHGDYSTNVAMVLAKPLGKSPREIAERIKLEIENLKLKILDRVEVAGPGFINFFISRNALLNTLQTIEEKNDTYGTSDVLKDTKVITEFTDPNPFKEFHIGHLYSNTVGEALSRLVESQGADIRRVCYQGDIGLHVAKAIWGLQKKLQDSGLTLENLEKKTLKEKAKFLGQGYAIGSTGYEENEVIKKEIIEINKKVFAQDSDIYEIYKQGKSWSLDYFETIYSRLGTKFDNYFFESEVGEDGKKLVLGYLEKGVFKESDGAVIFPGEEYGLHNRVFINSLGLPTYEAKELGLAPSKYDYFPYDQSIVITGNEINAYFKVLLKALSFIRPELAEKTFHIGHGMVRLPEGKMSSRTGNVITGEWLLDEAKRRVIEKMREVKTQDDHGSRFTVDGSETEEIAEKVGVAAVKYALLKSGIGGDIAFSFDESISFEGNSGPYLQYTYVRTQSILAKFETRNSKLEINNLEIRNLKLEIEEEFLLRHLVHFPEIVSYATQAYAPNLLCEYLYQLAQKFNLFYAKHKIVGSDNEQFRLQLTSSVGQVLKNGLTLLGIPTVEKM
jgi:arginyl-tRNA synthetase